MRFCLFRIVLPDNILSRHDDTQGCARVEMLDAVRPVAKFLGLQSAGKQKRVADQVRAAKQGCDATMSVAAGKKQKGAMGWFDGLLTGSQSQCDWYGN